jgi:uncharacterized protein YoxC
MPDDDLNTAWHETQAKIEKVQKQIEKLEKKHEELVDKQIRINDELRSKSYQYDWDKTVNRYSLWI